MQAGRYERVARGLYVPVGSTPVDWDWLEAAARRDRSTVCLTSALAFHDLTDDIPRALDVALPRGSRRPATSAAIRWRMFDQATFGLGRLEVPIDGTSIMIGLYDEPRSIVDACRLRSLVGYELGRDALEEWLRRGGRPAEVLTVAGQLPRALAPVREAFESLGHEAAL